jgi:hypothetical protein
LKDSLAFNRKFEHEEERSKPTDRMIEIIHFDE